MPFSAPNRPTHTQTAPFRPSCSSSRHVSVACTPRAASAASNPAAAPQPAPETAAPTPSCCEDQRVDAVERKALADFEDILDHEGLAATAARHPAAKLVVQPRARSARRREPCSRSSTNAHGRDGEHAPICHVQPTEAESSVPPLDGRKRRRFCSLLGAFLLDTRIYVYRACIYLVFTQYMYSWCILHVFSRSLCILGRQCPSRVFMLYSVVFICILLTY